MIIFIEDEVTTENHSKILYKYIIDNEFLEKFKENYMNESEKYFMEKSIECYHKQVEKFSYIFFFKFINNYDLIFIILDRIMGNFGEKKS